MYFAFAFEKWVVGRGQCMLDQMDIPGLVFNLILRDHSGQSVETRAPKSQNTENKRHL